MADEERGADEEPGADESPFHRGEQEIQARLGVRDKLEELGRRVIRDHMPDQHAEFYATLPFLLVGTVDERGRPWASLLVGRPGFASSPDPRRLRCAARPLFGDPLNGTLKPGADIGLLGIELATRRRNRVNGRLGGVAAEGFEVDVTQSFGNCPQYIQARTVELLPAIDAPETERPIARSDRLDDAARGLIEGADTLFIASAHAEGGPRPATGVDVSHRGGKPGFVRVEDEKTLVFPDFTGNYHFNTLGNILLDPRTGFLFVDFASGDLLYLTGRAEIVWEGEELAAFVGAERLIRFEVDEAIRVEASLPFRFTFGDTSPVLEHTGSWEQAAATIAAERERNAYLDYEVFRVEKESEVISSFYLRRADGGGLASYRAGQFLPIRVPIPGLPEPATRTYTVSDGPNADHYRLSIKREGGEALVSTFLHDHVAPGFRLEAMAPRGKFSLDPAGERPAVLISGGVGVTPMIAMTNAIVDHGLRTRHFRRTYFIHGARNGREHAFGPHTRELATAHDFLSVHIRFSKPAAEDRLGVSHDSEGHVDLELLKSLLPFDDHDFYLCGPPRFMETLYDGLGGLGVRGERIHYESFGPATLLKHDAEPRRPPPRGEAVEGPVTVRFAASGIEAQWSPDKGTLLEFAEAQGLAPPFSCRGGICGTCAARIVCGSVDYTEEPIAPHEDDEVLICCATPRPASGEQTCGEVQGIVLEL